MKKLILLFLFFTFFSKISFSQIVDQRLEKKYSKQEINKMIQDDPYKYHFLVYALDNACYTIDQPKDKNLSEFTQISLDVKSPLNFLDIGLEIKDQNQYFIIKGTNKLLVVKSNWVLNHELKTKQ
jgi:hypothetical protein